jgi:exodeoxyribonuclease VII small subunit
MDAWLWRFARCTGTQPANPVHPIRRRRSRQRPSFLDPQPPLVMAKSTGRSRRSPSESSGQGADDLSFRQAQTALELCLAELQGQDLDVEVMADLYRRAQVYAERCETVLEQVEQEVLQWDASQEDASPEPYTP